MQYFDKVLITKSDKWEDDFEFALLKLMLIKENIEYQNDFPKFAEFLRTKRDLFPLIFL